MLTKYYTTSKQQKKTSDLNQNVNFSDSKPTHSNAFQSCERRHYF